MDDFCYLLLFLTSSYLWLIYLDVKPPVITHFEPKILAKASQTTRILCEAADAELLFDVEWFKDGVQVGGCEAVQRNTTCRIHGDEAKYKLIWKGSGTELTIWNVHHPFDSGNFTCVVKNIGGMDAKTALLDVHGKCADGKQMPTNCELIDKIIRKLKALLTTRTSQVCIFNYLTKVTILLHALLQVFHSLHFPVPPRPFDDGKWPVS